MRKNFLTIALILIFLGLLFMAVSKSSVIKASTQYPIVKQVSNSLEITDVPLNKNDKFFMSYSGGSTRMPPEEMDVVVYDPYGNRTTFSYLTQRGSQVIANYTGEYKMELLAAFITRPSLSVKKVVENELIEYPNSNLLPIGLSLIAFGACIFLWSAKSSKRRVTRNKTKKLKKLRSKFAQE